MLAIDNQYQNKLISNIDYSHVPKLKLARVFYEMVIFI
jgi:hypothetical protein